MAVAQFSLSGNSSVGDLIAGSWSVTESVTPVDILDADGSMGEMSATFKFMHQGVANTPGATPLQSSEYVQGQPCSLTHPTLGVMNGQVLSTNFGSSTVTVDMSSPINTLNFTTTMPSFQEGQIFYSWDRVIGGSTVGNIAAMCVDGDGSVWVTGNTSGANGSIKYDRFGNILLTLTHAYVANSIQVDSAGNVYVCNTTGGVYKFNGVTGASIGNIVTPGAGTFTHMIIDRSDFIWVTTTDTTANRCIKKYNTSGTLQTQLGTYIAGSTVGTNGVFSFIPGISIFPTDATTDDIWVYNLGPTGAGTTQLLAQQITANVAINQYQVGILNREFSNTVGSDGYWDSVRGLGTVVKAITGTGMWTTPGRPSTGGNTMRDFMGAPIQASGPNDHPYVLAYDRSGAAYYVAYDATIYRFSTAAGNANQVIECYLGYAGFRGGINYGNTVYNDTSFAESYTFPPWTGNVWAYLKQLCARTNRSITTDGVGIYVNQTATRSGLYKFDISNRRESPVISQDQPGAQQINVTTQNLLGGIVWGSLYQLTPDDPVITVDAAGTSTTTIDANVYSTYISDAIAVDDAAINPASPNYFSIYSVYDTNGGRVPAATWTQFGGDVFITQSTTKLGSLDVSVVGPAVIPGFTAPFSIGLKGSPGLLINGFGISASPKTFVVYTSAPHPATEQITSTELNSPFLNWEVAGWDMARMSAATLSGGNVTCKVTIPVSSITVGFGRAVGGYFFWSRNYWRVNQIDYSDGLATLTASRDTRLFDVQDGSITHGQIDAAWSGFRYLDNYLSPGIIGA